MDSAQTTHQTGSQTTSSHHALLWAGAAVSIAEILTGTYLAPLGWQRGLLAIVIGHMIGGVLFFLVGYIGATQRKSAMETVKGSFGFQGGMLFALLNVVQLVGWTAIMIYDGALAVNGIWAIGQAAWCGVIGALIVLWLWMGNRFFGKINALAVAGLFILTLILSFKLFKLAAGDVAATKDVAAAMSFGAAVELAVIMPLSWLPLVSDYTRNAQNPLQATLVSTVSYGVMSAWMYAIGLGMALYTQTSDFAQMLLQLGLGVTGLLLIVLATVTTTFLDAYSAGVSGVSLWQKLPEKGLAIGITLICTIAAMLFPMDDITEFLYFLGSVFAPMAAIQIVDFFILKNTGIKQRFNVKNLIVWAIGFCLYRYWLAHPLDIGNTLPVIMVTMLLCFLVNVFTKNNAVSHA